MTDKNDKYFKIFNNVNDIIVLFDLDGNIVDINQTASDILGYSKSELLNNFILNGIIDKKIFQDKIFQTIENEISIFEDELRRKDETMVPVEIFLKLLEHNNDKVILGVIRSINKRKSIEKALKDKISEQELLIDSLDFQIWYLVEPESYAAVNKARAEFLGCDKIDLISKNIYEFQNEEQAESCIRWNKTVFEKKEQVITEEWLRNAKGEYRLCRINRTPKLDENNNVQYVICFLEDITERKKSEEDIKSRITKIEILNKIIIAGNEAKDLMNLLKIILSSTLELLQFDGGGIYLLDESGQNAELACNMGLPDEFIEEVKWIKTGMLPYKIIFKKGDSIFTDDYSTIHPAISKKYGILSLSSVPIIVKDKIIGALNIASMNRFSFSEDEKNLLQFISGEMGIIISKLKAEEKLKESEEQYRKAYNRVDFYKNLFAHDINNILQNIKMSCEISLNLIKKNGSREKIEIFNLMAKEQVNRAEKLVSNIRKISQLEEEEIQLKKVDIINALKSSIDYINKGFKFKKILINLNTHSKHLFVNGNELLQDVFENIFINSINYNQNPNIIIEINVFKEKISNTNWIKLEFIDNGIGIQDELKKRIFEREANKHPGVKGMGLGLSLVKKVVENYKGKIWVEDKVKNDYSKGSKFILMIPEIE